VLLPLRVKFEDVEGVLGVDLVVKADSMGNLIFLFHQIQLFLDSRVVLEPILPDLEQNLNHILHALVDVGFVKNMSKLVKHRESNLAVHFLEMLSNLACQADSNFDAIVGRFVKEEEQDLSGEHLVRHLLITQMSDESCRGNAHSLVVSLECFSELDDKTLQQQLANLWKLRVDDGCHGGVNGRKWQTGSLSLHYTAAEEASTADQVFAKELWHNVFDVGDVDLVDQPVD
jgi:hypothetical protein